MDIHTTDYSDIEYPYQYHAMTDYEREIKTPIHMTDYSDIEYPYQSNASNTIQYDYMTDYEYVLREINMDIIPKCLAQKEHLY